MTEAENEAAKLRFWWELTQVVITSHWTVDEAIEGVLAVLRKYGVI